jgi:hypothetical protein
VDQLTDSLHLRFQVSSGFCRLTYRWDSDPRTASAPFGDPVPVFAVGVRAGFHVHDVYHLTLLSETGFSEVLEILLAGARGGVFGGVDALAEEAIVLEHHLGTFDPELAVRMLAGKVSDADAVKRAFGRGDELRHHALRQLARGPEAAVTVEGLPASFVARSRRYRTPSAPIRRSRRGRAASREPVGRSDTSRRAGYPRQDGSSSPIR